MSESQGWPPSADEIDAAIAANIDRLERAVQQAGDPEAMVYDWLPDGSIAGPRPKWLGDDAMNVTFESSESSEAIN